MPTRSVGTYAPPMCRGSLNREFGLWGALCTEARSASADSSSKRGQLVLQRFEKCNQCTPIFGGEIETERVSFHSVGFRAVGLEAGGNIVAARAARVEPVFERRTPAAVPEHAAIPHAFERRNFVIARAAPSLGGETRIRANGNGEDIVLLLGPRWRVEAFGKRQLIVGIERRSVAARAAFALEYFLPALREAIELIRIGRRLERIDVKRQSVELLVAVTVACLVRLGQLFEIGQTDRYETIVARKVIGALIQR